MSGLRLRRQHSRSAAAAGFTLIELMLAIAILALITTLMWSSFSQASHNKKRIEAAQ